LTPFFAPGAKLEFFVRGRNRVASGVNVGIDGEKNKSSGVNFEKKFGIASNACYGTKKCLLRGDVHFLQFWFLRV
jgi:hypothetical protein